MPTIAVKLTAEDIRLLRNAIFKVYMHADDKRSLGVLDALLKRALDDLELHIGG